MSIYYIYINVYYKFRPTMTNVKLPLTRFNIFYIAIKQIVVIVSTCHMGLPINISRYHSGISG